jgi:hypothetical protein
MSECGGVNCQADSNNDARHQDIFVGHQIGWPVLLEEALFPSELPFALRLLLQQGWSTRPGCALLSVEPAHTCEMAYDTRSWADNAYQHSLEQACVV